jgi:hypothetical protein
MFRVLIIALFALALFVPPAQAQNAPPGNSGIDEYVEAVPSASGPKPTSKSRGDQGSVLTDAQREALERQGIDGTAAAKLAQRFGIPGAGRARTTGPKADRSAGSESHTKVSGSTAGASVASSLSKVVLPDAGSGLGPALPIIIVAIAAAGVAAAIVRRYRSN